VSECKRELYYYCLDDCTPAGCPGHKATLRFFSTINAYDFNINGKKIYLEHAEMQAMIDLIKKLDRCDTVKL